MFMKMYYFTSKNFFSNFMLFMFLNIINFFSLLLNNFYYIWMMMELTNIIFIFFLFINNKSLISNLTKYFILQIFPSMILISTFFFQMLTPHYSLLIMLMIMFKLGLFPFNWWPPMIMKKFDWLSILIFSSIMKFIPIYMFKLSINYSEIEFNFFFLSFIITIFINSLKSLMINKFKIMMIFSSINNSSWMIMLIIFSMKMFFIYFFLYMLVTFFIFMIFNLFNISNWNHFIQLNFFTRKLLMLMNFILFSMMAMLPPTFFFIIKLNSLIIFSTNNLNYLIFWLFLLLSTTLSILMYLNILLNLFFFNNRHYKLLPSMPFKNYFFYFITFNILSIFLLMTFY